MTTNNNSTHNVQDVQDEVTKAIKESKENFDWKQTFKDSDGNVVTQVVDMRTMSEEHLQKAFYRTQVKINEYIMLSNNWEKLCEKIEKVAEERGITLKDADGKKFKAYHNARRRSKTIS